MASKELRIDDGITSSDSSSDDEQQDTSMEEEHQDTFMEEERQDTSMEEDPAQDVSIEEVSPKSMPPKMRIKLSLRMPKSPEKSKTPTPEVDVPPIATKKDESTTEAASNDTASKDTISSSNNKTEKDDEKNTAPSSNKNDDDTENDEEEVVQATVVDSSDEGDANEVEQVQVKVEPIKSTAKSSAPKKRATSKSPLPMNARAVRLPPLSSPGMLIPPTAGVYRGDADMNGYTTPASVFDHCMSLAGYTVEARTEKPHRGSSVRRQVGDMFDSDVSFTLNFPPLVPKELWSLPKKNDDKKDETTAENGQERPKDNAEEEKKEENFQSDAAQLLLRSLACSAAKKENERANSASDTSRKRRRPWQFSEMVPLSLTLPYPESYVQKRLRYVEKVKERERAIVVSQEDNQKYEDAMERITLLSNAKRNNDELPPPPVRPKPIQIPPIPEPPSPPRLSEMKGANFDGLDESRHPIYLPKTHEHLTAHLDPTCYEIINGRYFNMFSNSIADPNFVGPNAPGISGLNLAGGSGLATAYSGGGSSGGSASAMNAAYYGSVGGGSSAAGGSAIKSTGTKSTSKKKSSASAPAEAADKPTVDTGAHEDVASGEPSPTSTSTGLKKIMDDGGDDAQAMKNAIIRAAVYASRVGKHGMSFMGTNGEVYPEVSKAFAAHAGVRPCSRCKNNKQGAYHCRLRRKHKDLDYDGGDSPSALAPLFQEKLDDLLLTK